MMSNQSNNNNENLGNITEDLNQSLHNNPSPHASNQQQILSGFSSAMSPEELQSSYQAIDPWFLYGGNIAAACQATNAVVEVHQRTREDTKTVDDDDKRKQRANSRLTAWQSRERKRIEFEVLQERETELKNRNLELLKENQQLKMIISSFKSSGMSSRDSIVTNELRHERDVLRLQQKGASATSSSQASRHILSRNFEDVQHQFNLPFQNLTALSTSNAFRLPSTNPPLSDPGSISSGKIPETRANRDLPGMFSLEPDPMTGVAPFPSTMEFSSNREATGRMISTSVNDEGPSLTGGTPQHVRGDMRGFSAIGMNAVAGSASSNFLYNNNDMLAPTIFAPLFRGDSNQEQSVLSAVNSHANDRIGQNSNRHLLFGSSLPFLSSFTGQGAGSSSLSANISSFLRSASLAEEKVDVPLFRAIRTARSQSQQAPQSQKRKRSQGKEDGDQAHDHEDTATSSDYTGKNAYARLSPTPRENVGVETGSKGYIASGVPGSELLFSDDNVVETPSFPLGDTLVSSLSNSNFHNDDGDES